eukprot:jgi/Mesvir1/7317/Mv19132-RA.1
MGSFIFIYDGVWKSKCCQRWALKVPTQGHHCSARPRSTAPASMAVTPWAGGNSSGINNATLQSFLLLLLVVSLLLCASRLPLALADDDVEINLDDDGAPDVAAMPMPVPGIKSGIRAVHPAVQGDAPPARVILKRPRPGPTFHPLGGGDPKSRGVVSHDVLYSVGSVPFPMAHAATIVETTSGTLVASFFGGTRETAPDTAIYVCRYENGAWTTPLEVAHGRVEAKANAALATGGGDPQVPGDEAVAQPAPTWNPVLWQAPEGGPLLLFYKTGPIPRRWKGKLKRSFDEGLTWGPEEELLGIGPVKNRPLLLPNGTLLCPSSTEEKGWQSHIEMTSDLGATWTIGPPFGPSKLPAIQPTFLQHPCGRLQMLARPLGNYILTASYGPGEMNTGVPADRSSPSLGGGDEPGPSISESASESDADGSQSGAWGWSSLSELSLPNPNSGIDAVTLRDGRHLLVYNHVMRRGKRGVRFPLQVALSEDGMNWHASIMLEPSKGEFSYPSVIQASDDLVHIVYTWNRKTIRHIVIDPAQMISGRLVSYKLVWPENWEMVE